LTHRLQYLQSYRRWLLHHFLHSIRLFLHPIRLPNLPQSRRKSRYPSHLPIRLKTPSHHWIRRSRRQSHHLN
jgi:hypothetical protein